MQQQCNSPLLPGEDQGREILSGAERLERIIAMLTIFGPILGVVVAAFMLWGRAVGPCEVALCIGLYGVTMLGITMGFHRLFTHCSFNCGRLVRVGLGIAGSMAAQGPLFFWAAAHRRHHRTSDREGDPHSPHLHGSGPISELKGAWHAHIGWMLVHKPENYFRLVPDLIRDESSLLINRTYLAWVTVGLLLPAVIAGYVEHSWQGALRGFVWGGVLRVFLVHHATWSINSACHLFGKQRFQTGDESRNNSACAFLTFGEGWHNNHHAFPSSARHGLDWWQIDFVYWLTRALAALGLVWEVRLPSSEAISKKLAL